MAYDIKADDDDFGKELANARRLNEADVPVRHLDGWDDSDDVEPSSEATPAPAPNAERIEAQALHETRIVVLAAIKTQANGHGVNSDSVLKLSQAYAALCTKYHDVK